MSPFNTFVEGGPKSIPPTNNFQSAATDFLSPMSVLSNDGMTGPQTPGAGRHDGMTGPGTPGAGRQTPADINHPATPIDHLSLPPGTPVDGQMRNPNTPGTPCAPTNNNGAAPGMFSVMMGSLVKVFCKWEGIFSYTILLFLMEFLNANL